MVFLVVGGLVLSLLLFLIGRGFLSFAGLRTEPELDTFEWTILLGGFVAASLSQFIHFAFPLRSGMSALVAFGLLLVLASIRRRDTVWVAEQIRRAIRGHAGLTAGSMSLAVLVALTAARPCRIEDTVASHAQILRWTEAASLVPGLAHVDWKLAFNSLWFPLEAVFSFAFLGYGPLPLLNTTVFLVGALYLFRQAFATGGSQLRSSLSLAMIGPYVVLGFLFAGSQSNDLPVLTYGLLAFLAASQSLESRRIDHYLLAICLACAAVCWKLSAMPLLLFVPLLFWDRLRFSTSRLERGWAIVGVFLVLTGAALIIRSVVLSGYPIYPNTSFDVFPVDWKLPAAVADNEVRAIRDFARGYRMGDPPEIRLYSMSQWIPNWIRHWPNLDRLFLPLLAAGAVLFPISFLSRSTRAWLLEGDRRVILTLGGVALPGAVFWFWQAPAVRFGAPYLTALLALLYLPWCWQIRRSRGRAASLVMIAAAALVAQNLFRVDPVPPWCPPDYLRAHPGRYYWWLPAPYPQATFVDQQLPDGSLNRVLTSGLPGYEPVPNSRVPLPKEVVRRGPRLSDGYRMEPPP